MRFQAKVSNIEKINPFFTKCKIRVLYSGLNRNNSYISKSSIEEAIPSIFNTPIVGEFREEDQNFGGHGGELDFSGDEVKWKHTTMPYGLIPSEAKVYWEEVVEDSGEIKEYLVVDDAYLWTGRYPEAKLLIDQEFNQSMEIEILSGEYSSIDGMKAYEIKKFVFSALCILGISKESDPDGHVEPCFESASIVAYNLDEEKFKARFTQMVSELKFSLSINKDSQGGTKVDKVLELLKSYELTLENLSEKGINHEDFSLEELEEKLKTEFNQEDKVQSNTYSLTGSQLFEEVNRELISLGTVDFYGYEYPRYGLTDIDTENSYVIAHDYENWYIVGFSYALEGDKVAINKESLKRFKINYAPMDLTEAEESTFSLGDVKAFSERYAEFKAAKVKEEYDLTVSEKDQLIAEASQKYETLQAEFAQVSTEYSAKLEQERKEAEEAIFELVSSELTDEEMLPIKEKSSEFTLEELEEKLFALVGKKKAKFGLNNPKVKSVIHIEQPKETKRTGKSYDVLFEEQ